MFPDNNLNEKFDDGTSSGDYMTTSRIQIQNGKTYSVRISNLERNTIVFYRNAGSTSGTTVHEYNQSSLTNGYKVEYDKNGYYTVEFTYTFAQRMNCSYFTVTAPISDNKCVVKEISNELNIVVDEPGKIRINQKTDEHEQTTYSHEIYLKDADHHYLYDLTKTGDNDEIYTEIEGSGYYTLDNIYDIIFFSYKYTKDADGYFNEEVNYSSNKILITVFDGYETVSQEYEILDLFRINPSINRNNYEGLVRQNTYKFNEDFLVDNTVEDCIEDKSQFGVTSELFSQTALKNSTFEEIATENEFGNIQTSALYLMKYNIPA